MDNNIRNTKIYQKYIDTKDIKYLHQLILSNKTLINKIIQKTILEFNITDFSYNELYSLAYESLLTKLKNGILRITKSENLVALYIRNITYNSIKEFITREREKQGILPSNLSICIEPYEIENPSYILENKDTIEKCLGCLNKKEAEMVKIYFGLHEKYVQLSFEKIGEIFNMTRSGVHIAIKKALIKMAKAAKNVDNNRL